MISLRAFQLLNTLLASPDGWYQAEFGQQPNHLLIIPSTLAVQDAWCLLNPFPSPPLHKAAYLQLAQSAGQTTKKSRHRPTDKTAEERKAQECMPTGQHKPMRKVQASAPDAALSSAQSRMQSSPEMIQSPEELRSRVEVFDKASSAPEKVQPERDNVDPQLLP